MDIAYLSKRFMTFAEKECKDSSQLYEDLSIKISQDEELLELSSQARIGQPIPNLLFGAVQYLLLLGKEHLLKEYYASIVEHPREKVDAFPVFKDFCLKYKKEIISILENNLVQTNEVRRCAYLYPSFCYIYNKVKKPLSLIEIGTSAGLQLLWDKYSYSYRSNELYGNKDSNVHITSEMRGNQLPPNSDVCPPVAARTGLDLHICDLTNPDNKLWLKALIWPEHRDRIELFEKASQNFINHTVKLIEGDGILLLAEIAEQQPKNTAICIFHTHVANQIPKTSKLELLEKIREIGSKSDVFHLYNNMWDMDLHLDYIIDGVEHNYTIGKTDGHGKWFEWGL